MDEDARRRARRADLERRLEQDAEHAARAQRQRRADAEMRRLATAVDFRTEELAERLRGLGLLGADTEEVEWRTYTNTGTGAVIVGLEVDGHFYCESEGELIVRRRDPGGAYWYAALAEGGGWPDDDEWYPAPPPPHEAASN